MLTKRLVPVSIIMTIAVACAAGLVAQSTDHLKAGWEHFDDGLPRADYRLVSMAFTDEAIYAAIDSDTPPAEKRGVGPEDGVYRYTNGTWRRIAPPINRYALRPILAAGENIYTVNHAYDRLYRLDESAGTWVDLGAIESGGRKYDCRKIALAKSYDGKIYCPGGKHEGRLFVYDIAANTWSEPIPRALPKAPHGINGFALSDSGAIYVSLRAQRADLVNGKTAIYFADFAKQRWVPQPFGVPPNDPDHHKLLNDYMNATGNKPGPAVIVGAAGDRVYASTQQGVFYRNPDPRAKQRWLPRMYMWYKGGGFTAGGRLFTTYAKRDAKLWTGDDRYRPVPEVTTGECYQRSALFSPDGRNLYASAFFTESHRDKKGRLKCGKKIVKNIGLVRYTPQDGPEITLGLDPQTAGYATDADQSVGTAILPDGDVLLAVNRGARGRILRMNADGSAVKAVFETTGRVNDLATNRDTVVVAAESGWLAFSHALKPVRSVQTDAPVERIAVAQDGRIATLSRKTVAVYDEVDRPVAKVTLKRSYVTDVEISAETGRVYVTGFDNKRNKNPVQVAFLEFRAIHDLAWQKQLWGFRAQSVGNDMADTRLYRVTMGGDGFLYVSGESAGGNTIFRWNGEDLKTGTLVKSDLYNDPWALASAHILYYAQIDPRSAKLIRGQFAIPRLVSKKNRGNTFRAKDGGLAVDERGFVYLAGSSACCIPNGRLLTVAGQRTGEVYAGGAALLVVSPGFKERVLWTTFGGGALHAVAARADGNGARFVVAGTPNEDAEKRKHHPLAVTKNAAVTEPDGKPGAYFAVGER